MTSNNKIRLILSAFNVHTGGGLVLLNSLFNEPKIYKFILDSRIKKNFLNLKNKIFIKRKVFDRLFYFHRALIKFKVTHLLCFNNLPPLFKQSSKVILFIQTFYFFSNILKYNFDLYTLLRIYFEKIWFRIGIYNVDEIWIQTPTMKKKVFNYLKVLNLEKKILIREKPLIDNSLVSLIKNKKKISKNKKKSNFFYPADSAGHKNHERLFLAFSKIDKPFKLYTTIDNHTFKKLIKKIKIPNQGQFINLNRIPREKILNIYKNIIDVLIFPSLDESFGIPLIEACTFKKNILVSNRKFAHDLIEDALYFDPYCVNSIFGTVKKYLNNPQIKTPKIKKNINFITPKEFIEHVN